MRSKGKVSAAFGNLNIIKATGTNDAWNISPSQLKHIWRIYDEPGQMRSWILRAPKALTSALVGCRLCASVRKCYACCASRNPRTS